MFTKSIIIFAIFLILVQNSDSKSIEKKEKERNKKVRCFKADKPEDMPQDVYEKYKISSKDLNEDDKKDFWSQFKNWWKNVFVQIGKFFKKVGKFFQNLFSKNKEKTRETTTEAPPTPKPMKMNKKKKLICVEYENDSNQKITTKVYEVDVSTLSTKSIDNLVTTVKSTKDLMTTTPLITTTTQRVETTTTPTTNTTTTTTPTPTIPTTPTPPTSKIPESTPFDPNPKTKGPVVIDGVENKVHKHMNTEATIVRAVRAV